MVKFLRQPHPWPIAAADSFRRDVAQPGRALAWGARGRQFKSARPDHCFPILRTYLPLINNDCTDHCRPTMKFWLIANCQAARVHATRSLPDPAALLLVENLTAV